MTSYSSGRNALDKGVAIGAALYHDAMKSFVVAWNDGATPFGAAPT